MSISPCVPDINSPKDTINLQDLPEKIEYVVGQELAINLLQKAVYSQRIAPAYLFTGIEGIGKRLTANCFAKSILHTDKLRNNPDVLIIEPTYQINDKLIPFSHAQQENLDLKQSPKIRREQIKEITQFISRKPLYSEQLIVIIEGIETLNNNNSNAFLKTLEEPGNATLILLTNQKETVLPTIKSRCQTVPFVPLSSFEIKLLLEEKGYQNINNKAEIMELARGSIGQAIEIIQHFQTIPDQLLTGWKSGLNPLQLAKEISQKLNYYQQLWLLDYWQVCLWKQFYNPQLLSYLESAKQALIKHCNPHLVWDICLIKLSHGIK
jgi:DNA polymerase III subunit delta'